MGGANFSHSKKALSYLLILYIIHCITIHKLILNEPSSGAIVVNCKNTYNFQGFGCKSQERKKVVESKNILNFTSNRHRESMCANEGKSGVHPSSTSPPQCRTRFLKCTKPVYPWHCENIKPGSVICQSAISKRYFSVKHWLIKSWGRSLVFTLYILY